MLDPQLTLDLRDQRPTKVGVYMNWRNLLFLHYACEPDLIQARLPEGLTVDTFPDESGREMAWVGVVAFLMERVRPRLLPVAGSCGNFPETNVRSYCHRQGKDPGVWFFSLDAANPFACVYARRFYSLPYHEANMGVAKDGKVVEYVSKRWQEPREFTSLGAVINPDPAPAPAPGSLEFFLLERYLLYSQHKGELFKGQVFHHPYPVQEVESWNGDTELLTANALSNQPFTHAIFSPGVKVIAAPLTSALQ